MTDWIPAPQYLRDFNGMRWSVLGPDGGEYGVFWEKYTISGCRWTVRYRSGDSCWGGPLALEHTMREAIAWTEERLKSTTLSPHSPIPSPSEGSE